MRPMEGENGKWEAANESYSTPLSTFPPIFFLSLSLKNNNRKKGEKASLQRIFLCGERPPPPPPPSSLFFLPLTPVSPTRNGWGGLICIKQRQKCQDWAIEN